MAGIKKTARMAGGAEDDVNVTPLLDIVFIMLIFFIVTSTFIKEPGVDVLRPKAEQGVSQDLVAILVAIDANNEVWINKEKLPLNAVRTRVEQLHRENPKGGAVVQADTKSHARYLIRTLEQIKAAGVAQVAVATEPT